MSFRSAMAMNAILFTCLCLSGCGGDSTDNPPTHPLSGKVTKGGVPVEGASLVFMPEDGKSSACTATTDAQGMYKATTFVAGDGAMVGLFKVRATNYEKPKQDSSKMGTVSFEDEQRQYDPDAKPVPPPKNLFPKKYESEATSGLSIEVKPGPNTFDIEIK